MLLFLNKTFVLPYLLVYVYQVIKADENLKVIRQWAEPDYQFPNARIRQEALNNGDYIPGSTIPIDVDAYYGSNDKPRIFITIARFRVGTPITLGTVDDQGRIFAYPDYSTNANPGENCDGLTSVFRVAIDKCDRLWVMDIGRLVLGEQLCPPQILAYDLKTNKLVYRFKIDASSYPSRFLFVSLAVDVKEGTPVNCSDTFVYVADPVGFGILVIDVANNDSWYITHRYMYPSPPYGKITIAGTTFDNMSGTFTVALTPYKGRNRTLYFHSLSDVTENYVSTNVLKNKSLISDGSRKSSLSDYSDLIKVLCGRRPNQSAIEAIDAQGIMYYSQASPPSIYCWNIRTPFGQRNFYPIAVNRTTLQFGSGVKIVNSKQGQELWVFTDRFQRFITGTLTNDTINFRILKGNISTLTKNSGCTIRKCSGNSRN